MHERAPLLTLAHAIRQRFYLFIAIVVALTVAAGVAAAVRPPSYRATATLSVDERFVSPPGFDISLQTGQPLVDHFLQLATSPAVLSRVCSSARPACDSTALGSSVVASAANGPGWINVSVSAGTAARAAALANAVAQAMIDQNIADDAQLVAPVSDYLDSELVRLQSAIAAEESTIAALQGQAGQQATIAGDQQKLDLLKQQYLDTSQRAQDLGIVKSRLDEILNLGQQATPPSVPYDPDPVRYLGVGLVVGLCLAVAVTLLIDRFDDRLFDTESLAAAAGIQLAIAVAPRDSDSLTVHASNPYAIARANLLATHPHMKKVMVVGASEAEELEPIAAGLGAAALKAGQSVLILDPDAPAMEMQHKSGRNGATMTVVQAPSAGSFLAADHAPPGAAEHDLVITLAPPPDTNPIALSLARSGEVAIVVATAGTTRFSQVKKTAEILRLAGIDIAATILSIGAPKRVQVVESIPAADALQDIRPAATAQMRLPTWRGPGT